MFRMLEWILNPILKRQGKTMILIVKKNHS